jgi:hypothetical protein
MTIFDFISDIIFYKKKNCLATVDDESSFTPYLVNRWLSMYSTQVAKTSNILNKYLGIFESKAELYSLFVALIPKSPNKKINYFKRKKEEVKETNQSIPLLAKTYELSQREISDYLNTLNLNKI